MATENIAPTSIIESGAKIGKNVKIGHFCVIGKNVVIGDNCEISDRVTIAGHTTLGENNKIFTGACVGVPPQDLKYAGEDTLIYLAGNKNDLQWDSNYVKKYIKEKIPVLKTFFISAKENIGVDDMFNTIICDCYNLLLDSNKKSSANKPTIKKKEKLFTFLFLGDISSGKPLFINLLIDDSYSEHKNSSTDLTKYTYKVKGKNILYYI